MWLRNYNHLSIVMAKDGSGPWLNRGNAEQFGNLEGGRPTKDEQNLWLRDAKHQVKDSRILQVGR